jgi:hypothetical protein
MTNFDKIKAAKAALYTLIVIIVIVGLIILGIVFPQILYYSAVGIVVGFVILMIWKFFYEN